MAAKFGSDRKHDPFGEVETRNFEEMAKTMSGGAGAGAEHGADAENEENVNGENGAENVNGENGEHGDSSTMDGSISNLNSVSAFGNAKAMRAKYGKHINEGIEDKF